MNTMIQDDHKREKTLLLPCTLSFILSKLSPAASVSRAGRGDSTSDNAGMAGRKKPSCALQPHGQGLVVVTVLPLHWQRYLKVALKALPMMSLRTSLVPAPIS